MDVSGAISSMDDGSERPIISRPSTTPAEETTRILSGQSIARTPPSLYFILFSVTGIERSNPRNPIIRFDAKVKFLHFVDFKLHAH
jgi:hypothetical protein